jgi:hypothetical protein
MTDWPAGRAEVLVHLVETVQHGAEIIRADLQHRGKADGRIHGVTAAYSIPKPEHVVRIDTELRHLGRVRRHRDKMLGNRLFVAAKACEQPVACGMRVGHRFKGRKRF